MTMPTLAAAVRRLSRLDATAQDFHSAMSAVGRSGLPALFRHLRRNKTLYQFFIHGANYASGLEVERDCTAALATLPEHAGSQDYPRSFRGYLDRVDSIMDEAFRAACALTSAWSDVILLKGSALRLYLPDYKRFQVDVDIFIGSYGTAIALLQAMRVREYRLTSHLMKAVIRNQTCLFAEFEKGHLMLGFHACFFPMASLQFPLALQLAFQERARRFHTKEGCVAVPSVEDVLVMEAAHISRHGYLTYRDINDAYLLMKHADVDVDYVERAIERNGLELVWQALMMEVNAQYGYSRWPLRSGRRQRLMLACLHRGRFKAILGAFWVQTQVLLAFGRRHSCLGAGLLESLRSLSDLVLGRLFPSRPRARELSARIWAACVRGAPRFTSYSNIEDFLRESELPGAAKRTIRLPE